VGLIDGFLAEGGIVIISEYRHSAMGLGGMDVMLLSVSIAVAVAARAC
jgi:hypothetical protein